MTKLVLPFLELMVIRTCNLSCQGCTTFSDLKYSGYETWSATESALTTWSNRIDIQAVGFMGGEPLINPEIEKWILGVRKLLPQAQIRFVTNGLLLKKKWAVVELLQDIGNTVLKISDHIKNPATDSAIARVFDTWSWDPVFEHGINRWSRPNQLKFQIARPIEFYKTFRGNYEHMQPHNSHPGEAFDLCVQKKCPLLYKDRLHKCGTLALTPDLLDRFNWPNRQEWLPYIDSGLGVDCSDLELFQFVYNFGHPNRLCAQCPSKQDSNSILDHRQTVTFKKLKHV